MRLFISQVSELTEQVNDTINRLTNNIPIIITTSGTTGKPKIVEKQVKLLPTNSINTDKWLLTFSPLKWSGVSVIKHVINTNGILCVPVSLTITNLIDCAYYNEVTHISITPSLFKTILLNDINGNFKKCNLKQITFGGEVASQSILDTAKQLFPTSNITHVYAQTELGDICAVSDIFAGVPKYKFDKPNYSFNEDNELIIDDINTQDIWKLENNRYYFIGRKQEIINVGGVKVSPIFVEDTIMKLGIEFAKVYGIKNPMLGNIVCLEYVGNIEIKELKDKLKLLLSRYEMPAKIIKKDNIKLSDANKLNRTIKE